MLLRKTGHAVIEADATPIPERPLDFRLQSEQTIGNLPERLSDEIRSGRSTQPNGDVCFGAQDIRLAPFCDPRLAPIFGDYPDIKLELSVDNIFRNIVEDGFDAGVRLGESVRKDMVAVRIGPDWRLVCVGSPDYFEIRSIPTVLPFPQRPEP